MQEAVELTEEQRRWQQEAEERERKRIIARQLDVRVAREVLELEVPEQWCGAIYVEGEWSLHPDSEVGAGSGWMCYSNMEPVRVVREFCGGNHEFRSADVEESVARMLDGDRSSYTAEEWRAYFIKQNKEWVAEFESDMQRWGHERRCLEVLPEYSTDIAAAMQVAQVLRQQQVLTVEFLKEEYRVVLWPALSGRRHHGKLEVRASSLAHAICLVALQDKTP